MSCKNTLINVLMNRSLRTKLLMCMMIISMLGIFISCYIFYEISYTEQVKQAVSSAQIKVEAASTTVSDSLSTFYTNMVSFIETPAIVSLFERAQNDVHITANALAESLDDLIALSNTSNLIDALLLITPDGEYISSRNVRLRPECENADIWPDYEDNTITWLSARKTPYAAQEKDVVALSFSFAYYKGFLTYVPRLAVDDEPYVFRLFIFFDYQKLLSLLQSDDKDSLSITYLAKADMQPLSMTPSSHFYNVVSSPVFIQQPSESEGNTEIQIGQQSYLVCIGKPLFSGLRVVNITSKRVLLFAYRRIANMIYLSALITILAAVILSSVMTRFLTRPLMKLVNSVQAIGSAQSATPIFVPRYNDEIGMLGKAIANMNTTIHNQMKTLKEEERKRSNAEIQMLTQQINPHFIYNTLDCIRWEILSHNIDGSSNMIENLATFLRLGFGHSGDSISVREEVTRVEQYLNIMRYRLNGSTFFSGYVDPKLTEWQIPKMILQPLVENSIKHAFASDVFETNRQTREIYIHCAFISARQISLSVEDNGVGIDIERAQASIDLNKADPSSGNIGLRNSYLRMRAFFGTENVQMRFSSTPFFLNRVEYIVSLTQANGESSLSGNCQQPISSTR